MSHCGPLDHEYSGPRPFLQLLSLSPIPTSPPLSYSSPAIQAFFWSPFFWFPCSYCVSSSGHMLLLLPGTPPWFSRIAIILSFILAWMPFSQRAPIPSTGLLPSISPPCHPHFFLLKVLQVCTCMLPSLSCKLHESRFHVLCSSLFVQDLKYLEDREGSIKYVCNR